MKFASLPVLFLMAIVNAGYPVQTFAQGFGFQLKGNPQHGVGGGGGGQAPMSRVQGGFNSSGASIPTAPLKQHFPAANNLGHPQAAPQVAPQVAPQLGNGLNRSLPPQQSGFRTPPQTQLPPQTILKAPPATAVRPQVQQPATSPLPQGPKGGTIQPPTIHVPQLGGGGQKPATLPNSTPPSLKISPPGSTGRTPQPSLMGGLPKQPVVPAGGQRPITPPASISGVQTGSNAKLPIPGKTLPAIEKGPAARPGITHPALGLGKKDLAGPKLKSPEAIRDQLAGGIDLSGIAVPAPGAGAGGAGPGGAGPGGAGPGGAG
ncbi:MAG TPA: hypothetical protein DDY91_16325, partial [Planctomycetaceae bacterium]|nr:hypothetical protein [Planctomycetaceae bacterium]